MNKRWKVFRDHTWTISSFPRQNTTILFNNKTKQYEFREGVPFQPKKPIVVKEKNYKLVNVERYKVAIIALASILGISIALNLFSVFV